MRVKTILYLFLVVLFSPVPGNAGEADVLDVQVKVKSSRLYRFDVTVVHADEGWDHYLDKWEVVAPDGTVLATRAIYQPNQDTQPFTLSLVGVRVPEGVTQVTFRAHDTVHGYSGKTVTVTLP